MLKTVGSHLRGNVVGYIALFIALGGTTYATTGGNFILGQSNSASTATQLSSGAGSALKVTNTNGGNGVLAAGGSVAKNAAALNGTSSAGNGVQGISGNSSASGVYGQNNSTGYGVAGRANSGTGVLGDSSGGWAFNASGNAKQNRAGGGFVKAMAYIDPNAVDPVGTCFNSQLPPSQATSGDCGISIELPALYNLTRVNFGFQVNDRIASATAGRYYSAGVEWNSAVSDTKLDVAQSDGHATVRGPFYIIVY